MLQAEDWQDIKHRLSDLDAWVALDPSKAAGQILTYAQRGDLTAITFLARIAEHHHANTGVADQSIPFFFRYDVGAEQDYRAGRGFYAFLATDYTSTTKQMIRDALHGPKPSGKAFLACGIADMNEEIPFLKEIIRNNKNDFDAFSEIRMLPIAWGAKLACARMGDPSDIRECIEIVRSIPHPVDRVVRRLDDIAYIRQPEAIAYLQEILFSDDSVPLELDTPEGVEAPVVRLPFARYAIHHLSRSLEGFPVEWKETRGYTPEDFAKAREWMLKNRQWKIIR
jgi:hypothetical protein